MYFIEIDGSRRFPGFLSLTYAMECYQDLLLGIRRNLLDWNIKLISSEDSISIFDSQKVFWKISPWTNIDCGILEEPKNDENRPN